jgi:hypothetical protein
MRTQLTDQKCAELYAKFKPFTVRRRYDSPLKGINYKRSFTVVDMYLNFVNVWVIKFKGSKTEYIASRFDLYEEPKEAPKPINIEPAKPESSATDRLIKYVSTHKDSMSSDSINHFARLIGLIKLGEI